MAGHPPITPEELARATEVYLQTASYTEAAAAIGRSVNGTRDSLRRHAVEADRRSVYARTLDGALAEAIDAERLAVRLLRKDLRKPKGRTGIVSALGDATRTLITARTAHAKLTGEHAPEKHAHEFTDLTNDEIDRRIAEHEKSSG